MHKGKVFLCSAAGELGQLLCRHVVDVVVGHDLDVLSIAHESKRTSSAVITSLA
jgi:hypothetical protein